MHRFKAKHFPALDGLRGIAILLVIIHHQLIPLSLTGGFLGVDLFFVLSGFLITTLLLTEFDATQNVSLKNFYARRVLRLAPALIVYLTFCLAATYRLHPEEFYRELRSVGIAIAYLANWRMALGWDFSFDPTAIIWSLSIEEQFYLAWPLVLCVCLALRIRRSHLALTLVFVVTAVMVHRYQLFTHGAELNRLYYGTDTRADAPLTGCLIALLPVCNLSGSIKKLVSVVAGFSLAYFVLTVNFTDRFLYLGGYTIISLLAGLLTWGAVNEMSGVMQLVLEWSPLRWLGKVSYGLYLWHWLILKTISFYSWFGDRDPWAKLAFTLLVTSVSFYLIEQPFNRLKTKFSFTDQPKPREETYGPVLPGSFTHAIAQPSGTKV